MLDLIMGYLCLLAAWMFLTAALYAPHPALFAFAGLCLIASIATILVVREQISAQRLNWAFGLLMFACFLQVLPQPMFNSLTTATTNPHVGGFVCAFFSLLCLLVKRK